MEQVIYGDILFIINFSIDFLTLWITSVILRRSCKTIMLVLAASIGALYAVVEVFFSGGKFADILICAAVSVLMCYMVFGWHGIRGFTGCTLVFWTTNMALGGILTASFMLINRENGVAYSVGGEIFGEILPEWIIAAAVTAGIVTLLSGLFAKGIRAKRTADLKITIDGNTANVKGLRDDGNLLHEPVGGRPVIILSRRYEKELLNRQLVKAVSEPFSTGLSHENALRLRFIPISTVGHSGVMTGIIPDSTVINGIERNVCVVFDDKMDFAGCGAIIPAELN